MERLIKDIRSGVRDFNIKRYIEHGFYNHEEPGTRSERKKGYPMMKVSTDKLTEVVHVKTDEHTNENFIYEVIRLSSVAVPIRHVWSRGQQNYEAVKIYDRPEMVPLTAWLYEQPMSAQLIGKVVRQVARIYNILATEHGFHHGSASVKSFYVNDKPLKLSYQGVDIDDHFTILVDDFTKSSVSTGPDNKIICSPWNNNGRQLLQLVPVHHLVMEGTKETSYYTMTDDIASQYLIQGYDYQSAHTSYDMYSFLVSFFQIPHVASHVFSNATLQVQIWDVMWYPEAVNEMTQWFVDGKKATVLEILSKARLKTNIRNMMLSRMATPLITQHRK